MMLNAYTQTTTEDYELLNSASASKRELELLEEIRVLKENLKAHADIISQIHETSARTASALQGLQSLQAQPALIQTQQQQQQPVQVQRVNVVSQQTLYTPPTNETPRIISQQHVAAAPARISNGHIQHANSVINTVQQMPSETIKYTIIADGNSNEAGEPIEIQIAEEDGALNLNSSADSGRLEICLENENQVEVKTESQEVQQNYATSAAETPVHLHNNNSFIKRTHENDSNYYFNEQGILTPMNSSTPQQPAKIMRKSSGSSLGKKSLNSEHNSSANSTPNSSISSKMDMDNVMVSLGPNNTRIPAKLYESMNWLSASIATRKLLMALFDRKTLATHSMTGKPSPAFKDHGKPLKEMLDPLIIQDIIFAVTRKCNVSDKEVRNAITTKCADENKMMKLQMNKNRSLREANFDNKENYA